VNTDVSTGESDKNPCQTGDVHREPEKNRNHPGIASLVQKKGGLRSCVGENVSVLARTAQKGKNGCAKQVRRGKVTRPICNQTSPREKKVNVGKRGLNIQKSEQTGGEEKVN